MRYHFIDYADASFKSIQDAQLRAVQHVGIFDTVYGYTRDWLTTTPFYRSYRTVLDMPRGGGYWAWKPYAILDAMSRAEPRSIIVYMDAGDRITRADLMRDVINHIDSSQGGTTSVAINTGAGSGGIYSHNAQTLVYGYSQIIWDGGTNHAFDRYEGFKSEATG